MITIETVKELRDQTGVSIMQCKKALEEAGGNIKKAKVILQKKGSTIAANKADRTLGSGVIQAYVHTTNDMAAVVVLFCETDFVAKNKEFIKLAYDIAMHVAASSPEFNSRDEITEDDKKTAKEVFKKEIEGKSEKLKDQILKGKLDSYFEDKILLEQHFIKDPERTIQDLIDSATQKFGEKIVISRFGRFSIRN